MRLKVTYRRGDGTATDVAVTTDATATVRDVAEELWATDPATRGASAPAGGLTLATAQPGSADHVVLPSERAIGETRVASGFSVQAVRAAVASPGAAGHAAVVRVVAGPDLGKEFHLPLGSSTLGRDPGCTVVLRDSYASKMHARIDVAETIELIDLDSANGLEVGGQTVQRWTAQPGEQVVIGDTTLEVVPLNRSISLEAVVGGFANASIPFNRSPRVEPRFPVTEHRPPRLPRDVEHTPFPWIGLVAPLVMGLVLYAVTRSLVAILFVAMMPLMIVGTHAMGVQAARRRARAEREQFDTHLARLDARLHEARATEREVRLAEAPSVAEVHQQVMAGGPLTWTRRPEHWGFLHVRLGLATQPSRNRVPAGESDVDGVVECVELLDELRARHADVPDIPLVESLRTCGSLGLVGAPAALGDLTRGVLVQLAGLYSPAEVVLGAIAPATRSAELEWLKWLPHASSPHSPLTSTHLVDSSLGADVLVAEIDALIEQRRGEQRVGTAYGPLAPAGSAGAVGGVVGEEQGAASMPSAPPLPTVVLVVVEGAHLDRARLVRVAEQGAAYGVHVVWIAERLEDLPAACRTVVDVGGGLGAARAHLVRLGTVVDRLAVEGVSAAHALDFARRLSAMVDAGALVDDASDLPRNVPIGSLLTRELDHPDAVVERWHQNDSVHHRGDDAGPRPGPKKRATLRALVGKAGADSLHLDLRTHGPHALVGGTTGSGKSEFLQAWVLGMATEYSPDRVTFLFVDYKGGTAFAGCTQLPHCVGLVTDLTPHHVRRALTSLRAEIHHRERLFNARKVKDILEFEERGDVDCPPALVLVIDEFAALATEVPEFVDGVVDVAQRGRSLGIHLIMATQRPAGVIKDNLRANTNLRIALRMADESDSADVLGTPAAAHFDPGTPGRAMAKTGPGRFTPFQSAYAGGRSRTGASVATIAVHELGFGAENAWRRPRTEVDEVTQEGPSDLTRLVTAISEAARLAGVPAPRRPWQDDLPETLDLADLGPRSDDELVYARADVPAAQVQQPVHFRPDDEGNMAVVGTGGTGKSTVLRTLAAAAAITRHGGPCDVYALDFGSRGLAMLEDLPHVGAVIAGSDHERVERLLRWLRDEVAERSHRYAAVRASSISEYRRLADRPDERRLLVLLDGLQAFRDEYELKSGSAYYTLLHQVAADGRSVGIHVVLTADRPGVIPTSLGATIQHRLVLRLADPQDYALYALPTDVLGSEAPPGRGMVEGHEVQVGVLGGSARLPEQAATMASLGRTLERRGRSRARSVERLPERVWASDLPTAPDRIVIGIGDADLAPFSIEPAGIFLVDGPQRSGRTTTVISLLLAVQRSLGDCPRYLFAARRSALADAVPWTKVAATEDEMQMLASDLATQFSTEGLVDSNRPVVVVVEGLASLPGSAGDNVDRLAKAAADGHAFVVGESEALAHSPSFLLLVATFKSARRGILLQPDQGDGESLFRTPVGKVTRAEFPPGRGMVVELGRASRVQVAMPD